MREVMGARWWWGGVWRRWGCASNFDNASARPLPLTLARLDPRSFRNEIRLARTESVGVSDFSVLIEVSDCKSVEE